MKIAQFEKEKSEIRCCWVTFFLWFIVGKNLRFHLPKIIRKNQLWTINEIRNENKFLEKRKEKSVFSPFQWNVFRLKKNEWTNLNLNMNSYSNLNHYLGWWSSSKNWIESRMKIRLIFSHYLVWYIITILVLIRLKNLNLKSIFR